VVARAGAELGVVPAPADRIPPDDRTRGYQGRISAVTGTAASTPPEIRPVRPEEYAETGALVEAAYTLGGILDNDRGYGAHVRNVAGRAPDHPVLVALRDGRIVGSVTITPFGSPQSELAHEGEVEFRYLAVAPEAWGTGVAQSLVAAVDTWAREHDARRLVLCVIESNDAAQALYARLGFERDPSRDWIPVPEVVLRFWQREL
jgi:ribosomal protein S18 acetylase RimI-like enzyme